MLGLEVQSDLAWTDSDTDKGDEASGADAQVEDAETLDNTTSDTGDAGGDLQETEAFVDPDPFEYPCEPGEVQTCVTACGSVGSHQCLKDWGPCVPPGEFCGNCADDDCDGLVNEDCGDIELCDPIVEPDCPVAVITIAETGSVLTGTVLHLSAALSSSTGGAITAWAWSVQSPSGSGAQFQPSSEVEAPSYQAAVAGEHLFSLEVWDEAGFKSCLPAQASMNIQPFPPVDPEIGCADGEREGFLELDTWGHIAACSGAWDQPGVTPDEVQPTCNRGGGDDGDHADGAGCSSIDLCAEGWHLCKTWHEVAEMSPTGCAGAAPPGAAPKSLFFAIRQPSKTHSQCGEWGDGFNDVFGCGNLGHTLQDDKLCGPLDRVLASTQPNSCGYNEAEPSLGPWECNGEGDSHLNEGKHVTKKGCPDMSCSYDGVALGSADKGGVLCCRDD